MNLLIRPYDLICNPACTRTVLDSYSYLTRTRTRHVLVLYSYSYSVFHRSLRRNTASSVPYVFSDKYGTFVHIY